MYRGFWPTLVGAGPRGAIGFGIFETLKPLTKQNELLRDRPGERPTTTRQENNERCRPEPCSCARQLLGRLQGAEGRGRGGRFLGWGRWHCLICAVRAHTRER